MTEALGVGLAGIALAAYLWAASGVRWPLRRTLAFAAGTAALAAALTVGDRTLSLHMLEHGLVVALAAPLLVLGSPITLTLKALGPGARARLLGALRSRPVEVLTHPALSWSLFVATQWALHVTPLLAASESSPALHAAEHAVLLVTALLFWAPVVGADPLPRRLRGTVRAGYLLAAAPAVDLAAAIFISQGHEAPGAVMLASMLPLGLAGALVTWFWMAAEQRRALREEALHVRA